MNTEKKIMDTQYLFRLQYFLIADLRNVDGQTTSVYIWLGEIG